MKNIKEIDTSETTEEQILQTRELLKSKYNLRIPKPDLLKLIKLMKELSWWLERASSDSPTHVSEERAFEIQKMIKKEYGKDITLAESFDAVRGLMVLVPFKEKQRLADEMRAIMVKYQKVKYDKSLSEKTAKLFQLHYEIELADKELKDLVYFISKTVWYEEGLDESPEQCVDDLLVYIDKRKRGKRTNYLKLHDKVRQSLDWAVKEKLKMKKFKPLYQKQ